MAEVITANYYQLECFTLVCYIDKFVENVSRISVNETATTVPHNTAIIRLNYYN